METIEEKKERLRGLKYENREKFTHWRVTAKFKLNAMGRDLESVFDTFNELEISKMKESKHTKESPYFWIYESLANLDDRLARLKEHIEEKKEIEQANEQISNLESEIKKMTLTK